ncbi:hypothetical protein [Rhodococcus sp. no. 34]
MTAYLSSPELIYGFLFELESPDKVARQVKDWIRNGEISSFCFEDANGVGEDVKIINWRSVRYFSVDAQAPTAEDREHTIVATAFFTETGGLSLYE